MIDRPWMHADLTICRMVKASVREVAVTALALLVLALVSLYAALGRSLLHTTSVAVLTSFPSDAGIGFTPDLTALYLQTVKVRFRSCICVGHSMTPCSACRPVLTHALPAVCGA